MPGEVPTAVSEQRRWGASEGEKAQVCGCRAGTGLGSRCGGEALSRSPPFVLRTRPRAPRGHAPRAPCPLQGSGSVQLPTGLASVCGCGAERAAPSAQSVPKGHLRGPVATAASLGSGSWARPEHQRRGGLVPSGGFLCPPDGDSGDLTLGTLPLAHLLGCLWAPPLASRCPGPPPAPPTTREVCLPLPSVLAWGAAHLEAGVGSVSAHLGRGATQWHLVSWEHDFRTLT